MPGILEAKSLIKDYPKIRAVDGLSLEIREGICFGLLGPNGAGKTTTIEMMEGITAPSSGQVLFRGSPIGADFKERSGIQFQKTALQDYLTVREALRMFGALYLRSRDEGELARLCALEDFLDQDSDTLSGGQRQRLLLAIALVNDPDVVFLDEPTTGLDPQARRNFWQLVEKIKSEGKTIVLSTHYMEEAYTLCDEVAIMDHGKIIAQGQPDYLLKERFEGVVLEIPCGDLRADPAKLPFQAFQRQGMVEIPASEVRPVLEHLLGSGCDVQRLKIRSRTLEDLFLELTGKDLRA